MRCAIITGGPMPIEAALHAKGCDLVFCADSGFDLALAAGVKVDRIFGDLDSMSPAGRKAAEDMGIPMEIYPVEKDLSDTEACLAAVPEDCDDIILICPLSGRIDHVLCNISNAIDLRKKGIHITLTDGITDLIPMAGPCSIELSGLEENVAISLMPVGPVSGVTTAGLYYPLKDADFENYTGQTLSNKSEENSKSFKILLNAGILLVSVTPAV